jgi:sugar lactone lactonase YvrE/enterochelin esterase-like enzyme
MTYRLLIPLVLLIPLSFLRAQTPTDAPDTPAAPVSPLVQKIQGELKQPMPPEFNKPADGQEGEMLTMTISDSKIYPGTVNVIDVFVPAQYDPSKPACLMVKLDGFDLHHGNVISNLIASKEIPVMIGVGIHPGMIPEPGAADAAPMAQPGKPGRPGKKPALRFNRSYEFDSMNDHFPDFIVNEVLPAVEKLKTKDGRAINISSDPNDRMVTGGSTGGIGSFTLAWRRPDQFRRVYTIIGTYVAMRGGNEYPALIRKTDPRPMRIFLEDGSQDAWNPLFLSWFEQNTAMDSALTFAGYDEAHAWGDHKHDGHEGMNVFPDVMRWLWRDYPAPIKPGISGNSTLIEITQPGQDWQKIDQTFQSAAGLAANLQGEVYLSDAAAATIYHVDASDKVSTFQDHGPGVVGQAFGPDGTLYGVVPGAKKIIAIDQQGTSRTVADGIAGHGIIVTHDGTLYVTEPGEHTDMPSQIWQIKSTGEKQSIDQGLLGASGVAFMPDGKIFYSAENVTKWVYSYVVGSDGTLSDKESFDWLHESDIEGNSGAEDMAVDSDGNLYVATRMGIQVCDQNGRVRAILPLPTPCGPVRSLCFGGPHFDILYATDGVQLFKRQMKIPGYAPWAAPTTYKSQGAG